MLPADKIIAIPDGAEGIRETLRIMKKIVEQWKTNASVRQLAMMLVRSVPEKDFAGELAALLKFVQQRLRYVKDITGVETLQSPVRTLELGQGDCDDKSILFASLAESLGHKTRFVAVGEMPGTYTHVYVEAQPYPGADWLAAETIENWPLGRAPRGMVARMVIENG